MNIAIEHGRLTRDPEIKTTASGMTVAKFSIAVDRMAKKGEPKKADFIYCVAFSGTAETIAQYCTKGQELLVVGHIQTGSYTTGSGEKRYTTDLIVDRFDFCGKRDAQQGDAMPSEVPF